MALAADTLLYVYDQDEPRIVTVGAWVEEKLASTGPVRRQGDQETVHSPDDSCLILGCDPNDMGRVTWVPVKGWIKRRCVTPLVTLQTKLGLSLQCVSDRSLYVYNFDDDTTVYKRRNASNFEGREVIPTLFYWPTWRKRPRFLLADYLNTSVAPFPPTTQPGRMLGVILGAFMTQGCVDDGGVTWVNLPPEIERILRKFWTTEETHGWRDVITPEQIITTSAAHTTLVTCRISSPLLAQRLTQWCGRERHERHVPEWTFRAPDAFFYWGLLDGCLSCAASIHKRRQLVVLHSPSSRLLSDLLLLRRHLRANPRQYREDRIYAPRPTSPWYCLRWSSTYCDQLSSSAKQKRFAYIAEKHVEELSSATEPEEPDEPATEQPAMHTSPDMSADRITTVTPVVSTEPYWGYDLVVAPSQAFVLYNGWFLCNGRTA